MTKIALLIIYNHRYDKNIQQLDALYAGKFSNIYHIMPFYDGDKENVIPVYASSYHFQSYIAQAYQHLKGKGYTHYFIIADDMIINPAINENNLFDKTGIGQAQSYIHDIREIYNCYVVQHVNNMRKYRVKVKGVEVEKILPNKQEAEKLFQAHHLRTGDLTTGYLFKLTRYAFMAKMLRKLIPTLFDIVFHRVKIHYPLLWGYSDILLLPAGIMNKFATYCGAFAATGLFVEYAIPTSLVFSAEDIITDKEIKMHGVTQIYPRKYLNAKIHSYAFEEYRPLCWEEEELIKKHKYNLHHLLTNFPEDIFFIHPLKLSKWE